MTRLVLVRHGESNVTVERVVGGPLSCTGLSALGRRQAEQLRDRLARTGELTADRLVASTLPRAVETAQIIAPALGDLPVHRDADLGEILPGEADGLGFDEFIARYGPANDDDPYVPWAPGAESIASFHHRVAGALHRLVDEHRDATVVVACHGGVVDAALRALLRLPMTGGFQLSTVNTSLTELARTASQWTLVRYNDAAHLEGLPAATRAQL